MRKPPALWAPLVALLVVVYVALPALLSVAWAALWAYGAHRYLESLR